MNALVKIKVLVFLQSHTVKKKKKSIFSLLGLKGDGTANPAAVTSTWFKLHTVRAACVARVRLPAASQTDV